MANKKVSQLTSKPSVLVTDLFPIADPSTGQLYKTTISDLGTAIGSGVSSVNGLVGAVVLDTDDIQELVSPTNKWFTDTRARAALSASSPLGYNSGTGVFSIPAATSSQNGYLTSTDWTTFNGKQAALSGTGFVKISGTTISYDNSTYALDSAVVKLTGTQTVAGTKTFSSGIISTVVDGNYFLRTEDIDFLNHTVQNSIRLHGITNADQAYLYFGSNTSNNIFGFDNSKFVLTGALNVSGNLTANSFIKSGGTSAQFLKADGSVDSSTYLTTGTASSTYLTLTGGTLTAPLTISTSSGQPLILNSTDVNLNQIIFNRSGTTLGKVYLYYDTVNSRPEMVIGSYATGGRVRIESGNNTTALTLDASQNAQFVGTISAAGATLTGALSGTSASFSAQGSATSGTINLISADSFIRLNTTGGTTDKQKWDIRVISASPNESLEFRTINDANNVFSTKLAISYSGNLGLGIIPSIDLDTTQIRTLELGTIGNFISGYVGSSVMYLGTNAYLSSTGWKYARTGSASGQFDIGGGGFRFLTAASGTAGNSISYTPAFLVNNSGYVGIGVSSATSILHVSSSVNNNTTSPEDQVKILNTYSGGVATIGLSSNSGGSQDGRAGIAAGKDAASGVTGFLSLIVRKDAGTWLEAVRINSGGLFKLQNDGSSLESSSGGVNEFNTNANDTNVVFRNTATSLTGARAGIDVFYRNATPNNTSAAFYQAADFSGGSRTLRFEVRSNGGIANYATNNVILSDERTKKEIKPLESYWNKFKAIEIVKYKYKDQTHNDFNIGVIAQQVESVAPEFVDIDGFGETPEDGTPLKSIYDSDLYHATIGVLKEAMVKIETLEAKIKNLENK